MTPLWNFRPVRCAPAGGGDSRDIACGTMGLGRATNLAGVFSLAAVFTLAAVLWSAAPAAAAVAASTAAARPGLTVDSQPAATSPPDQPPEESQPPEQSEPAARPVTDVRTGGSDPEPGRGKPGWVWWAAGASVLALLVGGLRLWRRMAESVPE